MGKEFGTRHPTLKRLLLSPLNLVYRLDNRLGISLVFYMRMGYWPNLDEPHNFNEKIQWIKLYNRTPLYPVCGDKFAMRHYVKACGFADLLVPLLWHGRNARDIPFEQLPDRFVLKTSHGCGYNILCTDKAGLNIPAAVRRLNRWKRQRYFECYGEWFYGVQPVRILAERYIDGQDGHKTPHDYKVLCFGGEPRLVQVDIDRFEENHYRNLYDLDWNLQEYSMIFDCSLQHAVEKPELLPEMLACARRLAAPFPFARVDFYISGGRLYLGEITLTHASGFCHIRPEGASELFGSWLPLPTGKPGAA